LRSGIFKKRTLEGIMRNTVLRVAGSSCEKRAARPERALRSVLETTMEITSLIVFVAMVGVWALAFGVAG
jgi:hypothetical protein